MNNRTKTRTDFNPYYSQNQMSFGGKEIDGGTGTDWNSYSQLGNNFSGYSGYTGEQAAANSGGNSFTSITTDPNQKSEQMYDAYNPMTDGYVDNSKSTEDYINEVDTSSKDAAITSAASAVGRGIGDWALGEVNEAYGDEGYLESKRLGWDGDTSYKDATNLTDEQLLAAGKGAFNYDKSQAAADYTTGVFESTNKYWDYGDSLGIWGNIVGGALGTTMGFFSSADNVSEKKDAYADLSKKYDAALGRKNMREKYQAESTAFGTAKDSYNNQLGLNKASNAGFGSVNLAEFGGQLDTGGSDNQKVTYIEGLSHEANPLGGIPMGFDRNGTPNTVEGKEVKWSPKKGETYIFSDKLM